LSTSTITCVMLNDLGNYPSHSDISTPRLARAEES
jgi:hypothetical protein